MPTKGKLSAENIESPIPLVHLVTTGATADFPYILRGCLSDVDGKIDGIKPENERRDDKNAAIFTDSCIDGFCLLANPAFK